MFRHAAGILAFLLLALRASAQEGKKPLGSVQISFLPPPLEKATYSLGIFEAKGGKLVRHLQEIALEKDFTVGLNGLSTTWDGKDDDGKPVPPGRYATRGYAVGPLKIEGEEVQDNDWATDDEKLRVSWVKAVVLVPADGGLAIAAYAPGDQIVVARYGGEQNALLWRKISSLSRHRTSMDSGMMGELSLQLRGDSLIVATDRGHAVYRLADGSETGATAEEPSPPTANLESQGKDGTTWKIEDGVLSQYSATGERLRTLRPKEGDPVPVQVAASNVNDRLYVQEEGGLRERVRGLAWKETKREGESMVSTWQTFFERNIQPPGTVADPDQPTGAAEKAIEINLDENPLAPGKPQKVRLAAIFDSKGSYLATKDGLKLRQVSERHNLVNAYLAKGKPPTPIEFFQYDGAATDVFSIKGVHRMMEFDAGEFEMTATGEKPIDKKAEEPPDL